MSLRAYWERRWLRRALAIVVVLALLAPVFGVAAERVGYTEPIEEAAETTGASGAADPVATEPFPDYSVPGLPGPLGTLVSALLGSVVVLTIALVVGRLLSTDTTQQ